MTQYSLGIIETHSYAWALKVLQNLSEIKSINFIKIETSGDSIVSVFFEGDLASIKNMIELNKQVIRFYFRLSQYHFKASSKPLSKEYCGL